MKIGCFDQTNQLPINPKKIVKFAKEIISVENQCFDGQINFVFVANKFIHTLNKQFLDHDYPTDVISFPLEKDGNYTEGEIYISLEQAAVQATDFKVTFQEETWRLVIHGILHLLGYDDQSDDEKKIMTSKENFYLRQYELIEREIV